jgi:hypothetical protein
MATPDPDSRLAEALNQIELLTEGMADLELAMEDQGWSKIGQSDQEFTRAGLQRNAELSRVMAVANPLVKRGLAVRAAYTWGMGVGVTGRDSAVNDVVQEFLDDEEVRECFTGPQAQIGNEHLLGTDGNVFIALFTRPLTGKVSPRLLDFDEIQDKILDPEDRAVTWYYLREWSYETVDVSTGKTVFEQHRAYYPDVRYRPRQRPKMIGGVEVRWESPIYHVKVNGGRHWKFGIGDAYAALPYARSYKEFLENWATLTKSLSRIAWQATTKSKSQAKRAEVAMQSRPYDPTNPGGAGATVNATEGQKIEAVSKSGATIDAESGRPLLAMVAAGLGLPVTTLSADPGQTGARAVAETLNTPTRLEFEGRRNVWADAYRTILGYVIDQAVIAPQGPLKGTVSRDRDRLMVELAGGVDRTLDITWPEIDEADQKELVASIVAAGSLDVVPPEVLLRLVLRALKVKDVDEIIDQVTDEDGRFIDSRMSAGQALMDQFRRGRTEDPMGDGLDRDDEDLEDEEDDERR